MATMGKVNIETFVAGADLSAAQFRFVKDTASGLIRTAVAGEAADGVLQNAPGNGGAASVATHGRVVVIASAAIAKGANIATTTDGRAVTAAAGNIVLGKAVEAATAAGQVITVDIFRGGNASA